MAKTPQTIFIVDDEIAIVDSLTMLMKSEKLSVKSFSNAHDFLDMYNPKESGCLLLDIRMPKMSGLELQKHLNEQPYSIPIIFMTGHGDIEMAVDAIKNGAEDFIQKPFEAEVLLKKIRTSLDKDTRQRAYMNDTQEFKEKLKSLTPREREIMERIIAGQANKAIAVDLGISQRTVEIHRSHIMQKTNTKSLAHIIKMAYAAEEFKHKFDIA